MTALAVARLRARVSGSPIIGVLSRAFVALVLAAVVGGTYARLYFGVDFTDESFYAVVPYRLVLGARPLIDETNVAQLTSGALLYPFFKLYVAIKGLDGIILYARHLHLLFCAGVAFAVSVSLARTLRDRGLCALAGVTAIALVPFGIHGLSYNTFGSGFFTIGCFLGFEWLVRRRRIRLVVCGCAHALAIFAYPPLAVPVACFFVLLYAVARPRTASDLLTGLAPMIAGVVAAAAFYLQDGVGTARTLFRDASRYGGQGGGAGKAAHIVSSVISAYPHKALAIALLAVAAISVRHAGAWRGALALLPFTAIPLDLTTSASANQFITSVGLLSPLVFPFARRRAGAAELMVVVWIPSALAGGLTALSSGNGSINFAIGFFPAVIVAVSLIALALAPRERSTGLVPMTIVLALGLVLQYSYVYRDAPMAQLSARVRGGAYGGIATTPSRLAFIGQLEARLAETTGRNCRILFYDAFPGGYLLGYGRPSTNTALTLDLSGGREAMYERLLLSYYATHGGLPDVAVRIKSVPMTTDEADPRSYEPSDPLTRILRSRYRSNVATRYFDVHTRVGTACRPGR